MLTKIRFMVECVFPPGSLIIKKITGWKPQIPANPYRRGGRGIRGFTHHTQTLSILRESDTSVRGSWISRRGPKQLRRCLYMSDNAAMHSNPVMLAFHQRLVAKGKKPLQAHCAIMRKLLILVRAVVVSGGEYQANFRTNRGPNA